MLEVWQAKENRFSCIAHLHRCVDWESVSPSISMDRMQHWVMSNVICYADNTIFLITSAYALHKLKLKKNNYTILKSQSWDKYKKKIRIQGLVICIFKNPLTV